MSVIRSEDSNEKENGYRVASGYARLVDLFFVSEDAKEIIRDLMATQAAY